MGEVASAPSFVEVREEDCRPSEGEDSNQQQQQSPQDGDQQAPNEQGNMSEANSNNDQEHKEIGGNKNEAESLSSSSLNEDTSNRQQKADKTEGELQVEEAKEAIPLPQAGGDNDGKQPEASDQLSAGQADELIAGEKLIKEMERLKKQQQQQSMIRSIGTSTYPIAENQEVTSTENHQSHHNDSSHNYHLGARERRGSRKSYRETRITGRSQQNYGLTYLPYKCNFEPSEDARRKADEFLNAL